MKTLDAKCLFLNETISFMTDGLSQGVILDKDFHPILNSLSAKRSRSKRQDRHYHPKFIIESGKMYPICNINTHLRQKLYASYEEDVVYLGFWDSRFGHMLTEGFSRWWILHHIDVSKYRFLVSLGRNRTDISQERLFYLLGLYGISSEQIIINLNEGIKCRRIVVPSLGYQLFNSASTEMNKVWETIGKHHESSESGKKVYLSRRKSGSNRKLTNEEELESLFSNYGFQIVYPDELSFSDQIRIVRSTSFLASCVGSGMHLSMFQKPKAQKMVIVPPGMLRANETIISSIKDTKVSYYIPEDVDIFDSRNIGSSPWTIRNLDCLRGYIELWLEQSPL